ncbi:hypothetical protein V8D89_003255 [Ganoderma adspersum]
MTTPFSTPRYPGAPNPTPRSTGKLPRAPIHNPYDKFTQPEFDAWIGDITGALKRALGREDLPPVSAQCVDRPTPEEDAEEEDLQDSFADVRARRLAKGKERAREEDFEDEERVSHHYGDENGWGETYSGADYSSEAEEEEESSEEEETPDEREPEVIDLLSDDEDAEGEEQDSDEASPEEAVAGPALVYDEEDDEGGYDEEVAEEVMVEDEVAEEDDVEDDAAEEDVEDVGAGFKNRYEDDEDNMDEDPRSSPAAVHEVTEILDSDDEAPLTQEEPVAERTIPARFRRKSDISAPVDAHVDEDQETGGVEEDEEQAEEQAGVLSPRILDETEVDIEDPWQGPRTYSEDFYAGGDVAGEVLEHADGPHVLPTEDENDELVDDFAQPPDVHDPWQGPRTYAEDFYSGGDILEGGTPSHLTPRDEEPLDIPGISSVRGEPSHSIPQDHDVVNLDADDLLVITDERGVSPVVQPVLERDDELEYANQPQAAQEVIAETPRSPSPPSPTLRSQVDWNWPPAFPGRIATGPGHLADAQDGIVEISDDEEDDVTPPDVGQPELTVRDTIAADDIPFGTTSDASPVSVPFSLGFDELYDMDSASHPYTFEPVASVADFGDLPPSREEQEQSIQHETALPGSAKDTSTAAKPAEELVENVEAVQEPLLASAPEDEPSVEGFVEEVDEIEEENAAPGEEIDVVSATGDDRQGRRTVSSRGDKQGLGEGIQRALGGIGGHSEGIQRAFAWGWGWYLEVLGRGADLEGVGGVLERVRGRTERVQNRRGCDFVHARSGLVRAEGTRI